LVVYELDLSALDAAGVDATWQSHSFPGGEQIGGAVAVSGDQLIILDGGNLETYETGIAFRSLCFTDM
jgi:hypothetical protein